MIQLRLNPDLDAGRFARAYVEHKCVQVRNFLDEASAAQMEAAMQTLPWRLILQDDTKTNLVLTREEFTAMPIEQRRKLDEGMKRRAAEGIGYMYFVYPMIKAALEGWDGGHPIHALTEFLNSAPVIEFARAISSKPGITKIDAHASCFLQGHYLNKHIDDGLINERQVAYTLGFTRGWKPDWGGLLVVYDENDDVLLGRCPRFNTMTVFDGRIPHGVTAIANFAPKPRYTVAGWFRDDPPERNAVA
jgi:SM-20-related protein